MPGITRNAPLLGVELVEIEGEVDVHLGRHRLVEVVGMPPDVGVEEVSGAAVVDVPSPRSACARSVIRGSSRNHASFELRSMNSSSITWRGVSISSLIGRWRLNLGSTCSAREGAEHLLEAVDDQLDLGREQTRHLERAERVKERGLLFQARRRRRVVRPHQRSLRCSEFIRRIAAIGSHRTPRSLASSVCRYPGTSATTSTRG